MFKKRLTATAASLAVLIVGCTPNVGNAGVGVVTTPDLALTDNAVPAPAGSAATSEGYGTLSPTSPDMTGSAAVTDNIADTNTGNTGITDNAAGTGNAGNTDTALTSADLVPLSNFGNAVPANETKPLDNKKIGWGVGNDKNADGRPADAAAANEKYGKYNAFFVGDAASVSGKKIMLTFDEGYENGFTAGILDTLKKENVKATFFVTYDYVRTAPELVKRMIDEGHTIGNHSYTHASFPELSDGEVRDELMKLHAYVKDKFGYDMKLARFPKGEFSERSLDTAYKAGYKNVFWSFAYKDWDVNEQLAPDVALKKILDGTHGGGIVLLHAVGKTNAEILPALLREWKRGGYVVTASIV